MTMIRWGWMYVVAVSVAWTTFISAAEISLPIEAPVVILPGTPATTPSVMTPMATRPVPTPTTPSGRLPQYQLGPAQLVKNTTRDTENAGIRFTLTLPDGPLLVEAVVMIDGKPYLMVRHSRLAQLLEQPPAESSAAVTTDLVGRLQRYRDATGRALTADEIDWWLTTAVEGPPVLWLKDGFQRFRADQRPAFAILDRNHDGTIDSAELARAEESLLSADTNRNDIVEFTELGNATRGKPLVMSSKQLPGITRVAEGNQSAQRPDLRITVNFHSTQPGESRMRIVQIAEAATARVQQVEVQSTSITMRIDNIPVMWEAVQVAGFISDQISLGCVNDGYPWLPALDLNDDGRLTVRERRQLQKQLAPFDANHDGSLTDGEAIAPFRIAIGLGPTVHRQLANIRTVHPRSIVPAEAAPEWFARMDRNKDRDLTRAEFPGTDEQFGAMDRDADNLIDVSEAMAYDQSQPKSNEAEAPTAQP